MYNSLVKQLKDSSLFKETLFSLPLDIKASTKNSVVTTAAMIILILSKVISMIHFRNHKTILKVLGIRTKTLTITLITNNRLPYRANLKHTSNKLNNSPSLSCSKTKNSSSRDKTKSINRRFPTRTTEVYQLTLQVQEDSN